MSKIFINFSKLPKTRKKFGNKLKPPNLAIQGSGSDCLFHPQGALHTPEELENREKKDMDTFVLCKFFLSKSLTIG